MEQYLWWVTAGIALVIVELLSGTFYLLVIGVAAFAGAIMSYLNYPLGIQAVIAAVVAAIGVVLVTHYRAAQPVSAAPGLDIGQSVVLDSWVSEPDRLARVRYRNALWDARVLDEQPVEAGNMLYIRNVDGNTLHVSKNRV